MTPQELQACRLQNQLISHVSIKTPAEVASHMVAMQAQDYPGALWSIGLRAEGTTVTDIEQSIENREIVRTWPMRGTLHFLAANDARWMTRLLGARVISSLAARHRNLEIDAPLLEKSGKIFAKALLGGKVLTRSQMREALESANISTVGQRGTHLMFYHALAGLLSFGPHQGKQPTFVLLDEWIPKSKDIAGEEAFAELALRYFTSHGPATIQDLAWWSGAKVSDIKWAVEAVKTKLSSVTVGGKEYWLPQSMSIPLAKPSVYLLPGFDEYMLGYRDRSLALKAMHSQKVVPGNNGMFMPTIVSNGNIAGLWKRALRKNDVAIKLLPFTDLSKQEMRLLDVPAAHLAAFLGLKYAFTEDSTGSKQNTSSAA